MTDDTRDSQKWARTVAALQNAVAEELAGAHHRIWPGDLDVEYTVVQRLGKVKIYFKLPASKEIGYKDA